MQYSDCVYLMRLRFGLVAPLSFFAIPIYRIGGFDFQFRRDGILWLRSFYMLNKFRSSWIISPSRLRNCMLMRLSSWVALLSNCES